VAEAGCCPQSICRVFDPTVGNLRDSYCALPNTEHCVDVAAAVLPGHAFGYSDRLADNDVGELINSGNVTVTEESESKHNILTCPLVVFGLVLNSIRTPLGQLIGACWTSQNLCFSHLSRLKNIA
jgi:hypothetical protein